MQNETRGSFRKAIILFEQCKRGSLGRTFLCTGMISNYWYKESLAQMFFVLYYSILPTPTRYHMFPVPVILLDKMNEKQATCYNKICEAVSIDVQPIPVEA